MNKRDEKEKYQENRIEEKEKEDLGREVRKDENVEVECWNR